MTTVVRTTLAAAALAAVAAVPAPARASTLALLAHDAQALTVRGGDGYAVFAGRAAVLGRAGNGLVILSEARDDCDDVAISGAEWRASTAERRIYRGRDLRIRVVSDGCRIEVAGRDIELSAVSHGFASVKGRAGSVKVNGGPWSALPDSWETYRLGSDPAEALRPTTRSLLRLEIRWLRAIGMSWARIKETGTWARFAASG